MDKQILKLVYAAFQKNPEAFGSTISEIESNIVGMAERLRNQLSPQKRREEISAKFIAAEPKEDE